MKITTQQDLIDHFKALGLRAGDDVVIHSKLASFGLIRGGGDTVLCALQNVLGERGTIVVPTYCFGVTGGYDPANTPSTRVGAFSEYMRKCSGAVRSASPIHSHAGLGPKADILLATQPMSSMGSGSDFEKLYEANFKLVLLGCEPNEGATYLHHLEALANVPYREWIVLNRTVKKASGEETEVELNYFAQKEGVETNNAFNRIFQWMEKSPTLFTAKAPYGQSHAFPLTAVHDEVLPRLIEDPNALVDILT
ncbi:MAG: hypothetical protein COB46_05500 [Rhodospirillaceae bacterium]|nr:MAG: hypothetical protein COB46_05500 [Rhodospirillaceae bacterium]